MDHIHLDFATTVKEANLEQHNQLQQAKERKANSTFSQLQKLYSQF